ncbi:hypothetical protein TBLA_0A09550 [Henningerozyma blattae CBS 6284]|uniref:hydroxyacylglutathione hydrolase n=1 Tax=Henningerozyma blattae (strain ATCC 34711 / CBS 6284 / DSM 70876 / NBRC 10599 / NRRL Y-10934 / UCD 77-7) TaxID=1071380 RepID=I2GX87_HENB6|nr:hypothetical protein TBLA_0A09550 [Tetrapisispora blattae CBS 6284]CCH58739.1 hypothetical protein TBLA_0A09550 [Tetrapisispora blattae CBS 6284]
MFIKVLKMRWDDGFNIYSYLLSTDDKTKSWLIDPGEPLEVIPQLSHSEICSIEAVVNTHHHYSHSGGNIAIVTTVRQHSHKTIPVIAGSDTVFGITDHPYNLQKYKMGSLDITFLRTPCHTQDSLCLYVKDEFTKEKCIFTGDTLFIGGCGNFIEGTSDEMYNSLNLRILTIIGKDNWATTKIYPGHEKARENVQFIRKYFYKNVGDNKEFDELEEFVKTNEVTTGQFTLLNELTYNPYLRLDDPYILQHFNEMKDLLTHTTIIGKIKQLQCDTDM